MDANAFGLCKENQLPIVVFNINQPGAITRVLRASGWGPSSDEHDSRAGQARPRADAQGGREHQARVHDHAQRQGHHRAARHRPGGCLRQHTCRSTRSPWFGARARLLTVQPFDKSLAQAIEKAIRDSDLGLNPATQGNLIRVPIPPLSQERRKELVKLVHKMAEEGRVAVRHARTDALRKIKKLEHISEDEKTRAEKDVQKLTDEHIKQIDGLIHAKEAEIMEV